MDEGHGRDEHLHARRVHRRRAGVAPRRARRAGDQQLRRIDLTSRRALVLTSRRAPVLPTRRALVVGRLRQVDERAHARDRLLARFAVGRVIALERPARLGHVDDLVATGEQVVPELRQIGRAREDAAHADDAERRERKRWRAGVCARRRGRRSRGRAFEDGVERLTVERDGGHAGAGRAVGPRRRGVAGCGRRQAPMMQRQRRRDEPGRARGRAQVADTRFDRAQRRRRRATDDGTQGLGFGAIGRANAARVTLEQPRLRHVASRRRPAGAHGGRDRLAVRRKRRRARSRAGATDGMHDGEDRVT